MDGWIGRTDGYINDSIDKVEGKKKRQIEIKIGIQ